MRKLPIALVATLTLGLFTGGCSPSIDAAAKADVDRRVAAMTGGGQNVDKPSSSTPMPMAVGQWLTYKVVSDKGEPSFLTMKLVGQDGSAFWYETLSETYYGKHATRMLVDFGDRRNPESMSIKAAKLRDSKGRVTEYPENMIGFVNSILRGQLGPIVIDWTGLPQEEVSVPAGHFAGCYKGRSEVSFAGFKSASIAWGHTAVPLSGMVRSQGEKGDSIELVGYGTSGAQSDF
jgi:hypothetical protein